MTKSGQATYIVLMLVCISITSCYIQIGFSQSLTTVKVEPSTASPIIGKTFTVTISLTNVQNLYGLEVTLNWNPAILEATNIDTRTGVETFPDGVLHESSNSPPIFTAENNLTQSKGEYRLAATSMGPASPFTGSGNIIKITFNPINLGNSALSLQSQLYDYPPIDRDPRISLTINHTSQDSSVTVIAAIATNTPSNTPIQSNSPISSTTPSQSNTPKITNTPASTLTPIASTPTATSVSPIPTQTIEPQKWNLGIDLALPLALLVILLISVSAFLLYRRGKAGSPLKKTIAQP
jgi:hypothetical protein